HSLRGASCQRRSHQGNRRSIVGPVRKYEIEQLGAIWIQTRSQSWTGTSNKQLRHSLVDSLAVDVKDSGAVGDENHGFAVRCPVEWQILPVIESQTYWFADDPLSFRSRHVDIWLRDPLHVHHALSVGGRSDARHCARIARQPDRCTRRIPT